ncbi:MAG: endonuclease domain-containing protein, partial [Mesorhizobium sp.]
MSLMNSRPPLRRASLATSPPIDGRKERREPLPGGALPLPPEGGEVALRSSDGV